ncbi:hypothetical protein BDZ94DRAFT_1276956 [Collybia nuda]|uniref:Uncharacterized protein n=1 Tax=Collybia nuda TaxID=64659 RepID=A0A9P5XQF8_9AGAR|nr:hypothetical protein BDZ94DRAFT_1277669 [Collybia nuda]KAF9455923.1 hypothetical protein BDZ94DRAFT_1276956 [Collybia nuda]
MLPLFPYLERWTTLPLLLSSMTLPLVLLCRAIFRINSRSMILGSNLHNYTTPEYLALLNDLRICEITL